MLAFLDSLCAALIARDVIRIRQLLAHPLSRALPRAEPRPAVGPPAAPLVEPSGNIPALRQPWSAAVPIFDGSNRSMLFQLSSLMLSPAGPHIWPLLE